MTVGEIQRAERLIHAVNRLADVAGGEARYYRIELDSHVLWVRTDCVAYITKKYNNNEHLGVYYSANSGTTTQSATASAEELERSYTMAELLAMEKGSSTKRS